ncbi:MAG: twin-arginine translocase subunit TatC [Myxococcota bacterium]|nr:twin-arginine translocase subunit TatC [Myxococcota bacterium]
MSDDPFNPEQYRMPLMEHLRELRKRLIVCMIAAGLGCAATFFFVQEIWAFLVAPMHDALMETGRGTMAITEPMEGFVTQLKVAAVAGIGASAPVIFYQIWRFVAPGLYPKEQTFVIPLVMCSTLLFAAGVTFGYTVIFRFAFPFFLEITPENTEAMLSINSYLSIATKLLLAFGTTFQLPVVIFALARIGLIDHLDLIHGFRYAIVAMFVVAAMITPPDVLSQGLMAGPLLILYGIGIIVARIFSTKSREPEAA